MSQHRIRQKALYGLLVAAQVPCLALALFAAVLVAHRANIVEGLGPWEAMPLLLAVGGTVYLVTLVVGLLGSLLIGLPLGAMARRLGWRTWRTWRGLALRGVAVGQVAAPAVVFIVAVLGGGPFAVEALLETFSAKTMIAGALLGTLGALTYWRIVYRRRIRFGAPLLSDAA
jgi:hypothetical protein